MRAFRALTLAAAAMCLSSCYNYDTDSFSKENLTPQQLAGSYKLTHQTLTKDGLLKPFNSGLPLIVLNSDGTFSADNVPSENPANDNDAEFHPSEFISKLAPAHGRWSTEKPQEYLTVVFNSGANARELFQAYVISGTLGHQLLIYIGDADAGHCLILTKQESLEASPSTH